MSHTTFPHPLVGKFVSIDDEDHSAHTVSRFLAEIGPGLMLARRIHPRTGKDFNESHIIVLAQIAQDEATVIFDSWDAYEHYYHDDGSLEDRRVIKLVPREDTGDAES